MKNCYLFNFIEDTFIQEKGEKKINKLILFFPYKNIKKNDLSVQLRDYFHENLPPDKIIVLCSDLNKTEINHLFNTTSEIYEYIPIDVDNITECLSAMSINSKGEFANFLGYTTSLLELKKIYKIGMTNIFNANGGLIISKSAHHFVFPSGKHSDRFLRPGNILIHGPEIFFIASALIAHFKERRFKSIFCDTSSINSLAFCYINFLKELDNSYNDSINIESFGSYKLFEAAKFTAERDSLFLISSSTSGSIIKRMTEDKKKNINIENVAVIFGLDVDSTYSNQIICDLGVSNENPKGLQSFISYNTSKGEKCLFCRGGSKPIEVQGDVFLLEKPIVIGHLISKQDAPLFLNKIAPFYEKNSGDLNSVFKCYFKDGGLNNKKYELYIDVDYILTEWKNREPKHPFTKVYEKLEKHILSSIPASIKYMIVLSDQASFKLAEIICEILNSNGLNFQKENIISLKNISTISKKDKGTIAVISSSIVSGRNLLFISRALRDFEGLYQRFYFTFISRTSNQEHLEFLESNLGLGEFGKQTHKIINVDTIFCSAEAHACSWHQELDNIKVIEEFCDLHDEQFLATLIYSKKRVEELNNSAVQRGLVNNLFFPNLKEGLLTIRQGFAFAPQGKSFIKRATQSEIYFIISSILNELRNKGKLVQSEYVRNIIDPGNFIRYNDGIIQASILRAATSDELRYDLTEEMDLKMKAVLGDMIIHIDNEHAEALNEFFYALAIKKLCLKNDTLNDCITLLEDQAFYKKNDSILKGLTAFIKDRVLIKQNVTEKFKTEIELSTRA